MNKYGLGLIILIASNLAHAQGVSIESMLNNFTSSVDPLIDLLRAISYVGGVYFAIKGIFKFVDYSKSNGQVPLSKPILTIVISAFLLSIGASLEVMTASIYGSNGPGSFMAPSTGGVSAQAKQLYASIFMFLKLVGFFAFVRGFFILAKAVDTGQDLMPKGFTHIIGGVLLFHFKATISILAGSTGLPLPF